MPADHVPSSSASGGGATGATVPSAPLANIVQTMEMRSVPGGGAYATGNHAKGVRVIIPKSGTLKGFSVWNVAPSGNGEGFILDTNGATRTVLWSSGSQVLTGSGAYQVLGDPNLVVVAGQHLDFALTIDNAVATIARATTISGLQTMPAGFPVQAPGGGKNTFLWDAAQTIPIGGSIAEASLVATTTTPFLIAYVL